MNQVVMRKCRVAVLAAVSVLLSQSSFTALCCVHVAASCDDMWSGQPALFMTEASVAGDHPFTDRLALPPGRELMVLAAEKGIDVTLTLEGDGVDYNADSPLQGFGVQRVLVSPKSADWVLTLSSKQDDSASATVAVRVIAVPSQDDLQGCVEVHRGLAGADAAYARGWTISNTPEKPAAAGDAESFYRASIDAYRKAFTALGRQPISALQATVMLSIGWAYYLGPGDWAVAESWARRAVTGYTGLGDERGIALAQTFRGMALIEVDPAKVPGSLALAAQLLRKSADAHAARGEKREQANALNNLGIAQYLAGEYPAATAAYEGAIELMRKLGERSSLWQVMDNMGVMDCRLGNFERARQTYAELLDHPGLQARPALYANVLANSSLVELESGEAGKALKSYQLALQTAKDIQSDFYEALSLQGIGGAYEALGDPGMALNFYRRALLLRTRDAGSRFRAETLRTIADVERRSGNASASRQLDQEALELADTDLDRMRMRLRIAADHEALGQHAEALAQLAPIVGQRVPGDSFVQAQAMLLRGRIRTTAGDWKSAKADLAAALRATEELDWAAEQFRIRIAMVELLRDQGDHASALREVDAAIELAERLRLQSANPGLRASLLETLRPAFDLKIGLLAARYGSATTPQARRQLALESLRVAERARSRSLQDYSRMEFAGPAGASASASAKRSTRRALYVQLRQYQSQLDAGAATLKADHKVLAAIRGDVADVRRQIDQIETELAESGVPDDPTLPELSTGRIPAGLGLIEYWLGAEQAYAWVITRDALELVQLGSSGPIAEAAVAAQRSLQDVVSTPAGERIARMQVLSALIWAPLRQHLSRPQTLVFVPDMALHYIPFAALLDGAAPGGFLIANRNVATTPSLRLLLTSVRAAAVATDRLLLVADPDYGTELPRLKGTAREADAIAAIVAADHSDRLQGRQATRERFLGASLESYRYIHVASHALADARLPQLSSLQLASVDEQGRKVDGQVFAADLLNVRLNADLVVLSACETALGRVVSGEGVIGLRYVLLARGAHAVASSLWKVGDRHAQELMAGMYASLFREKQAPPAALGAAMRTAISRHGADPAAWAGFDLAVRDLDLVL